MDEDETEAATAGNHFDACAFDDAYDNIKRRYHDVMQGAGAPYNFGSILHPIQDFYSHSNWIELGLFGDLLVEDSGDWPDLQKWSNVNPRINRFPNEFHPQILIAQDDKPDGISMSGGLRPELKLNGEFIGYGLITHSRPFSLNPSNPGLGDDCPDEVEEIEHPQINKDGPTNGDYIGDQSQYATIHDEAKRNAQMATLHEWCRLLYYLKTSSPLGSAGPGFHAVSIPLALWVDKGKTPDIDVFGCRSTGPKNIKMRASITNLEINNDFTNNGPGRINLVFALYTSDFAVSVRTQSEPVVIDTGSTWPPQKLPAPITACVSEIPRLPFPIVPKTVLTVQGWKDGNIMSDWGKVSDDDFVPYFPLSGPTIWRPTSFDRWWPVGDFTLSNNFMKVTFNVSFIPTIPGSCSGPITHNPPNTNIGIEENHGGVPVSGIGGIGGIEPNPSSGNMKKPNSGIFKPNIDIDANP
jgi:hypothetical protein